MLELGQVANEKTIRSTIDATAVKQSITKAMSCGELAQQIERLQPNAEPRDVARLCLLLTNSANELDTLREPHVLHDAWKRTGLKLQVLVPHDGREPAPGGVVPDDLVLTVQVAGVPGDAGQRRRRVAGDGVDLVAALEQEGQAVASDEAAGAGDQHTAHGGLPGVSFPGA